MATKIDVLVGLVQRRFPDAILEEYAHYLGQREMDEHNVIFYEAERGGWKVEVFIAGDGKIVLMRHDDLRDDSSRSDTPEEAFEHFLAMVQ